MVETVFDEEPYWEEVKRSATSTQAQTQTQTQSAKKQPEKNQQTLT